MLIRKLRHILRKSELLLQIQSGQVRAAGSTPRACSAAFQASWEERNPKHTRLSWTVRDSNLASHLEMGSRDIVSFWTL